MDTGQKTESLARLVEDIDKTAVVLPEFQRDFVWEVEKTFDLFDSFVRDIFVGSLIYGVPSFEITARDLDKRPRSGKGSKAKLGLKNYSKTEIDRLVKVIGFRLLLDGQQRATSIYRALKGIDRVYVVLRPEDNLPVEVRATPVSKRTLEHVFQEIRGDTVPGHICIGLHDVYRMLMGEVHREPQKAEVFLTTSSVGLTTVDDAIKSVEFEAFLCQAKNLENLFRQEKLIAYYLLDTDEEKFALFFERSNSRGIKLDFVDILAAKLYAGFNLRAAIETFEDDNRDLHLNREAIVRAISYVVSGGRDTGRSYILSKITHAHFNEFWPILTHLYRKAYDYLAVNKLLIHPDWMPYENMLIPLMLFLRHIPHYDFAQITELQARMLKAWYWLAILSRRYSSAAQTYVLEDSQALEKMAQGDPPELIVLIQKMEPSIRTPDDLYALYKKYDAVYKGVLNLINFSSGGLVAWDSGDRVSWKSNLDSLTGQNSN